VNASNTKHFVRSHRSIVVVDPALCRCAFATNGARQPFGIVLCLRAHIPD
jgi:hypothetical protein